VDVFERAFPFWQGLRTLLDTIHSVNRPATHPTYSLYSVWLSDIGRQLLRSSFAPLLYINTVTALFHAVGTIL